jgi:hypothetical protein
MAAGWFESRTVERRWGSETDVVVAIHRGADTGAARGKRYPGIKIEGTRKEGLEEKEMKR